MSFFILTFFKNSIQVIQSSIPRFEPSSKFKVIIELSLKICTIWRLKFNDKVCIKTLQNLNAHLKKKLQVACISISNVIGIIGRVSMVWGEHYKQCCKSMGKF
jgi:hypothetical protein